jgi:hypothetical protein
MRTTKKEKMMTKILRMPSVLKKVNGDGPLHIEMNEAIENGCTHYMYVLENDILNAIYFHSQSEANSYLKMLAFT